MFNDKHLPLYEGGDKIISLSRSVERLHRMFRNAAQHSAGYDKRLRELGIHPDIQSKVVYFIRNSYFLIDSNRKDSDSEGVYFLNRDQIPAHLNRRSILPMVVVPKKHLEMFGGNLRMYEFQQANLMGQMTPEDLPLKTDRYVYLPNGLEEPSAVKFVIVNFKGEEIINGAPLLKKSETKALIDIESGMGELSS